MMNIMFVLALFVAYMAQSALAAVRIMPFGASIVGAPGCWRANLWKNLTDNGYDNIDFVGSNAAPDCGFPYDGDNEGHAGALATDYAAHHSLATWLKQNQADILIIHLGTNDVLQKKSTPDIIAAYDTILADARASRRRIKLVVSLLLPLDAEKFGKDKADAIMALNKALVKWAERFSTQKSHIWIVDNWSGFDTKTDTVDGEHPNSKGDRKMSEKFLPAVKEAVDAAWCPTLKNENECIDLDGDREEEEPEIIEPKTGNFTW